MSEATPGIARTFLDEALRAGASAADLLVKESRRREVSLPERSTGEGVESGVSLRVFLPDGRAAFGAMTLRGAVGAVAGSGAADLERIRAFVGRTVESAALAEPSGRLPLPGADAPDGRGLGLYDPDVDAPPASLMEAASEVHSVIGEALGGTGIDLRLQGVVSTMNLYNTAGFEGSYRQTLARLDLTLAGSREDNASATRVVRAARSLRGLAPDAAAGEGAALLDERLDARVPPAGIHTVLLGPAAAAEIVAALSPWLARGAWADDAEARPSRPRHSERVASREITVTDDGRLPGGVASAPFDGEGTPTRRTVAVDRGVVVEILRDLKAGASEEGSTGNGIRGSFREPPELGPSNMFVNPGASSPADLQASIRQGIRISALGRIPPLRDPDTPFAVPFSGRWISSGRTEAPLAGGYLAGTLREILTEVEAAGSDFTFTHRRGSFGSPSLLVRRAPVRAS